MIPSTQQRETVIGVFEDPAEARRAIEDLKEAGFAPDSIGILMRDETEAATLAEDTGTRVEESAVNGALTGGVLGGLAGFLVGIGALAIPGIGPVIAAGPLAAALGATGATLTGMALGAGTGALAGALVALGIPEAEAQVYADRVHQGRILVTVKTDDAHFSQAWQLLSGAGAEDIDFEREMQGPAPA
jgi:uncharacterized membrane protein